MLSIGVVLIMEKDILEDKFNEFVKDKIKESDCIRKTYHINKSEALQIITLFELAKIHTHIDFLINK